MDIKGLIKENMHIVKDLRKKLGENPELSYKEYKTQEIICTFFDSHDIPVKKMFNTGAVATLNDGLDCVAIRTDMDALPVNGVSHACGHDYHMAVASGTALVLKKLGFEKCVKFIFQPGEEAEGGAAPMIEEGVLENPKVKSIVGFHVWPNVKVGTIEVSKGPAMASVDDFKIVFKGKGGHAAMPHLCRNPLYPAMDFIQAMNIKSRTGYDPLESHIITFSSVQCGSAPNVIADECRVSGTVRTFNNELRNSIYEDLQQCSSTSAERYGCTVDTEYEFQYPPLICDDSLTQKFIDLTKGLIGDKNVLPLEKTFAAEDFSFFAEKIPAVHFRLGMAEGGKGIHPLHSPHFDVSDEAIFHGIYIITNFVIALAV